MIGDDNHFQTIWQCEMTDPIRLDDFWKRCLFSDWGDTGAGCVSAAAAGWLSARTAPLATGKASTKPKAVDNSKRRSEGLFTKRHLQSVSFPPVFPGDMLYFMRTESSANSFGGFQLDQPNNRAPVVALFQHDESFIKFERRLRIFFKHQKCVRIKPTTLKCRQKCLFPVRRP